MISTNRKQYDADMKKWAVKAIDQLRPVVFLGPRCFAGRRFNDTEHVLATLETMTEQRDFEIYPLYSIEKALKVSASADYWYEHEKDYGTDVQDFNENDEEANDAC